MNSDLISSNGAVKSSADPDWQKQFEDWRGLLAKCGQKPNRKRVHSLRVATLRLNAEVDFWLLDKDANGRAARTARNWKKHAEKIRKALGPVRDNDVYLEMLRKMRAADGSAGDESRLTQECKREIEKLEHRFRAKRASAEQELLSKLDRRRERLERSSEKVQDAMGTRTVWSDYDRSRFIRGMIAGLASELPDLNADTLHEFRKRAKTARYLADVLAKNDHHAARQAALLKKIHNAAGKWHDLQVLVEKAQRTLGTASDDGLVKLLDLLAKESLQNALDLCQLVTLQLLDHNARTSTPSEMLPPKKPVRSVKSTEHYQPRLQTGTDRP